MHPLKTSFPLAADFEVLPMAERNLSNFLRLNLRDQSNCGLDLSSSATAAILRGAPLGGEIERKYFVFFTLRCVT
jgi:hypothetical protein